MTDSGAIWVLKGDCRRGASNDGVPTLLTDNTLTSISPAPGAGYFFMIDDILVGADAAGYLSIKEETSGTLLCPRIYFSGAGFYQITPRNGIKTYTANKKIQGQLSATFNCSVLILGHILGGTLS